MKADGLFTDHVAAKPIYRIKRNNYFLLCQNQPDVVISGVARTKLLNLHFEGKQLRQLGRQLGLIASGALR